jgi:hypothetical protein
VRLGGVVGLSKPRKTSDNRPLPYLPEAFMSYFVTGATGFIGRFLVQELQFDVGQGFPSPYHRTKFESEKIVREECPVPWRIYRPAVVIGHSETGAMDKIDEVQAICHSARPRSAVRPSCSATVRREASVIVDEVATLRRVVSFRTSGGPWGAAAGPLFRRAAAPARRGRRRCRPRGAGGGEGCRGRRRSRGRSGRAR